MRHIVATLLCATVLLGGCAKPPRYDWGGYDTKLYQYYREPNSGEFFRASMEELFAQLESRNQRPAPGLYAEVGTLYLERGDRPTAAKYYVKERDAWPESRYLMDTMLKSLERMARPAKPE